MKYWRTILLGSILWVSQIQAASIEGKILNVLSGDRVEIITTNKRTYTISLRGIKSPETERYAKRMAKKHLAMLVAGKTVFIEYNQIGRNRVILGTLKLGGSDINLRQVHDGMAKAVPKLLPPILKEQYQTAESKARQNKLGIWRLTKEGTRKRLFNN